MKKIQDLNNSKVPIVAIDPTLAKAKESIAFPEKLERANEVLRFAKLPPKKHHR